MIKKLLPATLFVLLALLSKQQSYAQLNWVVQSSGCANHLYTLDFVDEDHGWAVGMGGSITRTVNGGDTWQASTIPGAGQLTGVSFVNALEGWVLDYNSSVYRTTDGGSNWTCVYYNPTAPWTYEIYFTDSNNGWVSRNDYVMWTDDGGTTWDSAGYFLPASPIDIEFADASTGYMMAAYYCVSKTTDGGLNWTQKMIDPGGTLQLNEMAVVNATTLYVASTNGIVFFSDDSGDNWTQINTGLITSLYGIDFYDDMYGVAVGDQGYIISTSDGGQTWAGNNSMTTEALFGIEVLSKVTACASGNNGLIRKAQPGVTDVQIDIYMGNDTLCQGDQVMLPFQVKNNGLTEQQSGTFAVTTSTGDPLGIYPWSGSLMPNETETIEFGPIAFNQSDNYLIGFTGDTADANNIYTFPIQVKTHTHISNNGPVTICPGDSVELLVLSGSSYQWLTLGPDDTLAAVTVAPTVDTWYPVEIGYADICKFVDTVVVEVEPGCLEAANAFSPNGDGINDFFYIEGAENCSNIVTFYNRWGDQVAQLNDYNNNDIVWYGDSAGKELTEGTYYYTLQMLSSNGNGATPNVQSGWIQIVR